MNSLIVRNAEGCSRVSAPTSLEIRAVQDAHRQSLTPTFRKLRIIPGLMIRVPKDRGG